MRDVSWLGACIDTPQRLAALGNVCPRQPNLDSPNLSLGDAYGRRNVSLHHAFRKHVSDLPDCGVVQLGGCHVDASGETLWFCDRAVVLSARSRRQHSVKHGVCVPDVFQMRDVLKVCKPVVRFATVPVVDGHSIDSRPDKCLADQPVNEECAPPAVPGQTNVQVAVVIRRWLERSLVWVVSIAAPYVALIRNLVNAIITKDRSPFFLHTFIVPESSNPGGVQ